MENVISPSHCCKNYQLKFFECTTKDIILDWVLQLEIFDRWYSSQPIEQ
jgi:hypothetical protein